MADRFLRSVKYPVRRESRRVVPPERHPDDLYPYPDTFEERFETFLWKWHRVVFGVLGLILFAAAGYLVGVWLFGEPGS